MSITKMHIIGVMAMVFSTASVGYAAHAQAANGITHPESKQRARIAFAHSLPKLSGDRLRATVVEVNYGPGESSKPHSHPCAVIGYVVRGSIRTQVKGQAEALVNTGESFYEAPNGVHLISANASQTEPASFIVFFVCDSNEPLSTETPTTPKPGGR